MTASDRTVAAAARADLSALVEEAYTLFQAERPDHHGCCRNCCMYPEVEARLLDWPVRDVPAFDIRDWFFAASDHPFPRPVMKWFLPRVLEMLANGCEVAAVGTEVALDRLRLSGFPEAWPENAVDFMTRFGTALVIVTALCPKTAADPPADRPTLDEVICMLGQGGVDLTPALARLDTFSTETLVAAISRDWALAGPSVYVNPFWDSGPAKDQFYLWLTSEMMLERMMAHGMADQGSHRDAALEISEAILAWREWYGLG